MSAAESLDELGDAPSLVDLLLAEQGRLRAVDEFSTWHEDHVRSRRGIAGRFETLIPASAPAAGQQYGFSVDLDACTGCKACVTACHSLNGLEWGETWRKVGEIERPAARRTDGALRQTVTTACHHCADPACLAGCPVRAYEKDPATGVVIHLDDQCIGCRYCQLMCPYDVPQYSERLGIVRKCDLCHARLAAGEAPACVQGCPNEAISIALVEVKGDADTDPDVDALDPANAARPMLLPMEPGGMAESRWTRPTTVYRSNRSPDFADPTRPLAAGGGSWSPVDDSMLAPAAGHTPLAVMLVLTQASIGALIFDRLLASFASPGPADGLAHALALVGAAGLGFSGLAASVLHLGRPQWAFRAVLGLRTSWMSREIVCFGAFAAALAIALAATAAASIAPLEGALARFGMPAAVLDRIDAAARLAAVLAGIAGLVSSILIYAVTGRPLWRRDRTARRFIATAIGGGASVTALAWVGSSPSVVVGAALVAAATGLVRSSWERGRLSHGDPGRDEAALARTRALLESALASEVRRRRGLAACAVVLQGYVAVLAAFAAAGLPPWDSTAGAPAMDGWGATIGVGVLVGIALCVALAGEVVERRLFFRSEAMRSMPGVR